MSIYYITKDCLTQGIYTLDLEQGEGYWSDMASGKKSHLSSTGDNWFENVTYCIDKECFLSKADAIKNANERRDKAISQARKKIEKLDKLKFE